VPTRKVRLSVQVAPTSSVPVNVRRWAPTDSSAVRKTVRPSLSTSLVPRAPSASLD
jgi:hypothetical protein